MKEITCTNCKEAFPVDEEHYNSKAMIFNCNCCGVEIRRSEESGEWEATESRSFPEKPKVKPSTSYISESSKPRTLIDLVHEWRDRIVTIGWFFAAYNLILLFLASGITGLVILAVLYNIGKCLLIAYFVSFLLTCLAEHLKNQREIIKQLKD